MLDANTFYIGSQSGVSRTADAGKSWLDFNTGLAGATVMELFSINGELYAGSMNGFVTSTDGGKSWTPLPVDNSDRSGISSVPVLETFDNVLYMKGMTGMAPQILRLSTEDNRFIPIPEIPVIFEKPTPEKAEPLNNDLTNQINQKSNKAIFDALNDAAKQDLESGKAPNTEDIDFEQINEEMKESVRRSGCIRYGTFSRNLCC